MPRACGVLQCLEMLQLPGTSQSVSQRVEVLRSLVTSHESWAMQP